MTVKIGVISDTHSAGNGRDLPLEILDAFHGVDLILHCGDLECLGVLDSLETVAPVLAVRGYADPTEEGDRLATTTRVVPLEGVNIGMVHDIQWPTPGITTSRDGTSLQFPRSGTRELLAKKFGEQVNVVVFGDTHEELICYCDGVLLVNPGSPTYPGRRHSPGKLGTLGLLYVNRGAVDVRLIDLATL